jgi:cell pole-organizing protein PopZ
MSQSAKAQEPSMEEILASIRRIIADDDSKPVVKAPEPPKPAPVAVAPATRPAVPPSPPPRPPAPNKQDEIDAMLADLEPPKPAPKPPAPKPAPAGPDVLDLTEAMAATAAAPVTPPAFRTIDGASDVVFAERGPDAPEPRQAAPTPDRPLMSSATRTAVDSAFNSLANTVLGNGARTLEDLVKEMLRPMLKAWIDDNLPGMVERIVRAEIERVSRGR